MGTNLMPPVPTMLRAFRREDAAFDGRLVVGVKTTGVFCRPVCRAKPARAENLEFFASNDDAARHGYRQCKLCHPTEAPLEAPASVSRLMALLDAGPSEPLRGAGLRALGIDPATARRKFRAHVGMTFSTYQKMASFRSGAREMGGGGGIGGTPVLWGGGDYVKRHASAVRPLVLGAGSQVVAAALLLLPTLWLLSRHPLLSARGGRRAVFLAARPASPAVRVPGTRYKPVPPRASRVYLLGGNRGLHLPGA